MRRYRFYLLGDRGQILRATDHELADDETALELASSLVDRGARIDVLRGAKIIGSAIRDCAFPAQNRASA